MINFNNFRLNFKFRKKTSRKIYILFEPENKNSYFNFLTSKVSNQESEEGEERKKQEKTHKIHTECIKRYGLKG